MRVNVYEEELTDDMRIVWTDPIPQESGAPKQFCGVRVFLHSSPKLHHSIKDDDRSAVTFWLGTPDKVREFITTLYNSAIIGLPPREDLTKEEGD